jgi:hypothetical protein
MQFCELDIFLQTIVLNNDKGNRNYIWNSQKYSSAKAYKHLIGSSQVDTALRWLWSPSCQPKHKVFFQLLLQDRLNRRGLLRRKTMNFESYTCELCIMQREENLRHLFFRCSFAKNCWLQLGIQVPTWL